jgi:hypothetical protein
MSEYDERLHDHTEAYRRLGEAFDALAADAEDTRRAAIARLSQSTRARDRQAGAILRSAYRSL